MKTLVVCLLARRLEVEAQKASGGLWDLVFLVFFEVEAAFFGELDLFVAEFAMQE